MLYYKFQNYEEFKSIFGIQIHGNGAKNRKNKILLAYIKNRELLHQAVKNNDFSLLHISNIPDLKQEMKKRIKQIRYLFSSIVVTIFTQTIVLVS